MFKLSQRSMDRLAGVHPDLVAVVHRAIAITPVDFCVLEGLRSVDRQKQLFAAGASSTMRSRHLTGHAVDLGAMMDGEISWKWPLYDILAVAMKQAGADLEVPIEWGGDWISFRDGVHFQLPYQKPYL